MKSTNRKSNTKNLLVLIAALSALHVNAQIHPFVYYTFDGGTSYQWNTWGSSSNGYSTPQCTSSCSANCGLIIPSNDPVIVNTSPVAVGNYALFNPDNGQLKNNNIALSNNGISIETLIRFDDSTGIQRRANLFTLSRPSSQSQPGTYLNFYFNFDLTATDGGAEINFTTDPNGGSTTDSHLFSISLDGLDRKSVPYYLDGNWHHVAFSYNPNTGLKKIWVDGVSPAEFSTVVSPVLFVASACSLTINSSVGYDKLAGAIDELAYYNDAITDEHVAQHFNDFKGDHQVAANHYTFRLTLPQSNNIALTTDVDPNEFPYGHIVGGGELSAYNVTHTALQQLYSFTLPRYKPHHGLHKNMNIVRSKWIGDNSSQNIATKLQISLDVQKELAAKWNYYFNLSENLSVEINQVNQPNTYPNTWMNWVTDPANHSLASGFEYAMFTNRAQSGTLVKNQHFGDSTNQHEFYSVKYDFSNNRHFYPYIYLNRGGNVSNTKYWLPVSDINNYTADGITTKSYLDPFLDRLYNSTSFHLSFITENNEVAPVYNAETAYDLTANLPTAFKFNYEMQHACPGCNQQQWLAFLGDRKIAIDDTAYRDIILNDARLNNTNFLNYAVDGGPDDRYYWLKLRQTQRFDSTGANGLFKNAYSTMDFYPITPSRWRIQVTNLAINERGQTPRGWRWAARARKTELAAGDKLFAPYVGAGWFLDEERNFRPGQWLGLMKCLGLTGVDFYQAYYDEISGNPKGYIWQVAIPSYAQAVLSRIDHFMLYGNVLEGDVNSSPAVPSQGKAYAFNTGNPLQLAVIRQDANELTGLPVAKYAISGSAQKIINMIGDAPLEQDVTVDLKAGIAPADILQFKTRRQGSTYVLDRTRANANDYAFYQLDKWHQWEHPERWNKDLDFEAEVFDNPTPALEASIHTENENRQPITNGDYRNFTSYVSGAANTYEYNFEPRASAAYHLFIRARLKAGAAVNPSMNVTLTDQNDSTTTSNIIGCIGSTEWLWYMIDNTTTFPIQYNLNTNNYRLSIHPLDNDILIDRIYLGLAASPPDNGVAVDAAGCPGIISFTAKVNPDTCNNGSTGSVIIAAMGGSSSYDFSVNRGAWQTVSNPFTIQNLSAGSYTLQVRDHNSIADTSQVLTATVSQPPTPFVAQLQVVNNCNNLTAGKITAVVTGGNMNSYKYLWNTGAITGTIDNLPNGAYTVTVTDAKGCTVSTNATITTKTFTATASATSIASTCGSGTVVIAINTPTGGVSPYFYSTNGGVDYGISNFNTTANYSNQLPGNSLAAVKDFQGCQAIITGNPLHINGTFNTQITSTLTPSLNLSCTGNTTNLTATPASSAYKYLWSTGQTTSNITNISGGIYHVTVTQASGNLCAVRTVATVNEPEPIAIALTTTNVTCNSADNGSATAVVTGGTGAKQLLWSNGASQSSIAGLPAGNYSISVTDTNGCNALKYFTIVAPATSLTATILKLENASCNQLTGALTIQAAHGVSPYQYLWSNNQTASSIDSLSAGTYTVTVTDAFGCFQSDDYTLLEPIGALYYLDADSDGYGDGNVLYEGGCSPPAGYVVLSGDCNDLNPSVYPGASEICNGIDDNCDDITDVNDITFNLRFFIEGFYNGNNTMRAVIDPVNQPALSDTVTVELRNDSLPYNIAYSFIGVISTNGYLNLPMPGINCGMYYITIKHRNSLVTWSKFPVAFELPVVNFDFTVP